MNQEKQKTVQQESKSIYSSIIVALIFLFNPNISVIDILPDFVAYFLLARAFLLASDCAPHFEEARDAFTKLAWLNLSKILGLFLIVIVRRGNSSDNDIIPLVTLVFAICEAYLGFLAIKSLFSALFYIGNRTDCEATIRPIMFMGRKIRPEAIRDISYIFFVLKCLVYFIPTPFMLTNFYISGVGRAAIVKWFIGIILFSQIVCVIAGIFWLCIMRKYAMEIKKEGLFTPSLYILLKNNKDFSLPKKQMLRSLIFALTLFEVGVFFCIELALVENYDVNVIPHFIYASLFLFGAYKITEYSDGRRPLLISGGIYLASTVIFYIAQSRFLTKYGYASLVTNPKARDLYPTVTALGIVEFISLTVFLFFLYRTFDSFVKKHTGINDNSSLLESNESYFGKLCKKNRFFLAFGIVAAILRLLGVILRGSVKLVYSDTGDEIKAAVISPAVEWIGLAIAITAFVYIGVSLYFLSTLKDEVKMKYESETASL